MTLRRFGTHFFRLLLIITIIIAGVSAYLMHGSAARYTVDQLSGVHPIIATPQQELLPSLHIAKIIGWQGGAKPVAAAGLKIENFAKDLDHPRWLLTLPNGDVLVSESNAPPHPVTSISAWIEKYLIGTADGGKPSANRISLLRATDGNGVANKRYTLLAGLHSPSGMAFVGDVLYVADTDALLEFPYHIGETRITAKPRKIIDLPANPPNFHWARNVIPAEDGKHIYVTVGSNSNIADNGFEGEKNRANILEVDPKTGESRIYSAGMRNPNGLAVEPKTKAIWVTVNERDMLGPDLPPDYLTRLEFAADYGWPYTYWGGYTDPRIDPQLPDNRLQYFKRPEYALGAHTASLGIAFANNAKLGVKYNHGAFIAQHGSWNRRPAVGYRVVYIAFGENGYPNGMPQEVISGFLDRDGKAQGRPVDVAIDSTGALLVSDDAGGRIWRVTQK